jgi:hypothetical protein
MYADDTIITTNSEKDMIRALELVNKYCQDYEIKINIEKTHYMYASKKLKAKNIVIENSQLKPNKSLKYLGHIINKNAGSKEHIESRLEKCISKYFSLTPMGINDKSLKPYIKAFLYKTYIQPVLLYGTENMSINISHLKDINTHEGNILKRAFKLHKKTQHTPLAESLKIIPAITQIKLRKLAHAKRLLNHELTREMIEISNQRKILPYENTPQKTNLLDDIYEIINESKKLNINDLEKSIYDNELEIRKEHKTNTKGGIQDTIRFLIEKGDWSRIEDILTPSQLKDWQENNRSEITTRINEINRIYEATNIGIT